MIKMYACSEKGEGKVMLVGEFESIEDIEILVGHFDKDVEITFSEELEKEE